MKNKRLTLLLTISIFVALALLIFFNIRNDDSFPVYTLEQAQKKKLLLSQYNTFTPVDSSNNFPLEESIINSAYSYSIPENNSFLDRVLSEKANPSQQPNVLLLKTSENLEEQGTFFAIDNKGKTGNIFSGDSIYAIELFEPNFFNRDSLKLYLFKIEKLEEKYIRTLKDSIWLKKQ
ncbi:hypothetical protein [Chondrinema litorale]|uniref:hypothetical protein n=1 Tax=Chondrinema litorale TaxID=2994555 RepID=UPI0025439B48|nr:hypothetical protein [Chondrinema litorale]UZR95864.1 hypothetical protein OQ292_08560 [Chondrinema litorale]